MAIPIKNTREIESMRKGGAILGKILHALEIMVAPGVTTLDLEKKAESLCKEYDVTPGFKGYHGYPYILCTSINENVVHTFPSKRALQEGDLINIDCGIIVDQLYTDSAVTVKVGTVSDSVKKLYDTVYEALYAGINQAQAGNRVGFIGETVQKIVERNGFTIIRDLIGHGVGKELHEEPQVPNFGHKNHGPLLEPGMTIAIEPIIAIGSGKIKTLDNNWDIVTVDGGVACQAEHTVLITEGKAEILTKYAL